MNELIVIALISFMCGWLTNSTEIHILRKKVKSLKKKLSEVANECN